MLNAQQNFPSWFSADRVANVIRAAFQKPSAFALLVGIRHCGVSRSLGIDLRSDLLVQGYARIADQTRH